MVSFRDSYNNMLKKRGGNTVDSTLNATQKYIERHFREDKTYRAGYKMNGLSKEPIDFRISNAVGSSSMDRNIDIKKIIFRPSAVINSGDYIIEANNYWLITECEYNSVQPKAIGYNCNNYLRVEKENNIIDVYGYFLKGTFSIQDGELIKMNNNDLTCIVGTYYKDVVKKYFKSGETRFLINGSAFKIDGIDNITGINKGHGIYTITLKSDVISPLDDLENGIAYNGEENITPQVFTIEGKDKIIKGNEETYTVIPFKTGISFQLDEWSISNGIARIVSQNGDKCIIQGLKSDEQVLLSIYDGSNELCNKTIWIVR